MTTHLNDTRCQPGPPDVRPTSGLTSGADDAAPLLPYDGVRDIALGEMARRRRRLGSLTPEQERALESLMVSVADNIFSLMSRLKGRRRE